MTTAEKIEHNTNIAQEIFMKILKGLTNTPDRHIKGHASALLKRLQELNPQDYD